MIAPLEAAWEIHKFLTSHKISYVVIGGLAVQYWGEPRFTRDVDLTVLIPLDKRNDFVDLITKKFTSRIDDPKDFVRKTHMVLVEAPNGCEIDISVGVPGYEEEVIRRATKYELAKNKRINLCSAEDLIIHKAVAGRPRDIEDIEGIVYRQAGFLDMAYIRSWLKEFSLILERQDLLTPVEKAWRNFKKR